MPNDAVEGDSLLSSQYSPSVEVNGGQIYLCDVEACLLEISLTWWLRGDRLNVFMRTLPLCKAERKGATGIVAWDVIRLVCPIETAPEPLGLPLRAIEHFAGFFRSLKNKKPQPLD